MDDDILQGAQDAIGNAVPRFIEEGSTSKLEIEVENLAAYCEGSLG